MSSLLLDHEDVKQDMNQSRDISMATNAEFPLVRQLSCQIRGKSFEFVVQCFVDKIFVIITDKGRIGQIVSSSIKRNAMTGKVEFNTNTVLGLVDDFSIINLLSRQLIEQISKTSNKMLLLGVGFDKDISHQFLPLILKCIDQIKVW